MADRQIIINSQIYKLIPLGFCACGCGGKTTISIRTSRCHGRVKGKPMRYIHGHNWRTREKWNYLKILCPGHPRADRSNYVLQHILIAEKALGKPLPPGTQVHHANGSRNSGPLVVCQDDAYHKLLHRRMKAIAACGHKEWRKCYYCLKWDEPNNLYINSYTVYHRKCHAEAAMALYQNNKNLRDEPLPGPPLRPIKESHE